MNIAKFLKTPILKKIYERLLLWADPIILLVGCVLIYLGNAAMTQSEPFPWQEYFFLRGIQLDIMFSIILLTKHFRIYIVISQFPLQM